MLHKSAHPLEGREPAERSSDLRIRGAIVRWQALASVSTRVAGVRGVLAACSIDSSRWAACGTSGRETEACLARSAAREMHVGSDRWPRARTGSGGSTFLGTPGPSGERRSGQRSSRRGALRVEKSDHQPLSKRTRVVMNRGVRGEESRHGPAEDAVRAAVPRVSTRDRRSRPRSSRPRSAAWPNHAAIRARTRRPRRCGVRSSSTCLARCAAGLQGRTRAKGSATADRESQQLPGAH